MFQNLPTKKTLDNVPIVEIVIFCTEIVITKVTLWCFFIGEVEIGKFRNLQPFQDKIVVWKYNTDPWCDTKFLIESGKKFYAIVYSTKLLMIEFATYICDV